MRRSVTTLGRSVIPNHFKSQVSLIPNRSIFCVGKQCGTSGRVSRFTPRGVRSVSSTASSVPFQASWCMRYRLPRWGIKISAFHLGLLLGATLIVPEPLTVINAFYRFLSCFGVCGCIAFDYRFSLKNLEGDEYQEKLHIIHDRSAKRLLRLFQYNKGIFIKFGQHLAALDYLLPEEYTSVMKVLQNHAPHVDFSELSSLFEEEFGKNPHEVFDFFDEQPIAAASLAQVHKATLNGQDLAVKIQFPGLRDTCSGDSLTIKILLDLMTMIFPEFVFGWLIKEVNINLPKELNFYKEAQNSAIVKANFANQPNVIVPDILWDYTTDRILVMEFCKGTHIDDVPAMKKENINCSDVAVEITNIFDKMAFEDGFIHCDPHPGNLLIRPRDSIPHDGFYRRFMRWSGWDKSKPFEIVLLDHGLYRDLEKDDFKKDYLRLWDALINFDEEGIEKIANSMGASSGYQIFCSILTARTWDSLSNPAELDSKVDTAELERIAKHAQTFLREIINTLAHVKPELLLLFKTNDLLRAIHRNLDSGVNTFVVTSKNVDRILVNDSLQENNSLWNYTTCYSHRFWFLTKVTAYEWYMYFKNGQP